MTTANPLLSPGSGQRIGAMSFAIIAHLVGVGLLAIPLETRIAPARPEPPPMQLIDIEHRVVPPTQTVPPPPNPPPRPPTPRTATTSPVPTPVPVIDIVTPLSVPVELPSTVTTEVSAAPVFDPGPALATLRYRHAPPPAYPGLARRRGQEGEVLLRVRVNAQGVPEAVTIQRSSGHRILDEAARDHVLARWRFEPAMQAGRPVAALAVVPILFRIDAI